MSTAAADDDIEHWPDDHKHWTEPAVTAPGYDSNNGLRPHLYLPPAAPAKSPSPAAAPSPPVPPQVVYTTPVYYAHMQQQQAMPHPQQQPQYYSHPPQPGVYTGYPPHWGGYYTYAQPEPQPQVVAAPVPARAAQPSNGGANFHVYQPAYSDPKNIPKKDPVPLSGPPANVWLGRTKAQVEEDNMKIAKREGAYNKHKVAPVDVKDDQIFWVVELDGSHSLRDFRHIKELNGAWKKDPRFEDSYYFVCEEEEEEMK